MRSPAQRRRPKAVTLVLSGAVTRGAFEAGVLKVIAQRGIGVRRIFAASSGALNATAFAAGVRTRSEEAMADAIDETWDARGGFWDIISPSARGILRGEGFSDQDKLLAHLRRYIQPRRIPDPAPVDLHILVSPLNGIRGRVDGRSATTSTVVQRFAGECFDRAETLERVFAAAVASAAFPMLFVPVHLGDLGPCIDGGLVSGTPIHFARGEPESDVDTLVVVASTPAYVPQPRQEYRGMRLLSHVIDMMFSERLYWDLHHTTATNEALRGIERIAAREGWSARTLAELKAVSSREDGDRVLDVISIRPVAPLPGEAFSGFFSRRLRRHYIEAGRARAGEVLDELGWR